MRLHDTVAGEVVDVPGRRASAGLYVCGITPYDAAHLGHAATYVAFDLLHRAWLDAGHEVRYVQNVTDVDDPLLERATATGVGWADLAEQQTDVFRDDMAALAVVPPHAFVGVTEVVPEVGALVLRLEAAGAAYRLDVDDDGEGGRTADVYFDVASVDDLGAVSGLDRDAMLHLAAERGGDPDRAGKRDPLDPLLWRGRRGGRAVVARRRAARRAARLARGVRGHRPGRARPRLRGAGRRLRPRLPPPRDGRRPQPRPRPAARTPAATCTPAWSPSTARR